MYLPQSWFKHILFIEEKEFVAQDRDNDATIRTSQHRNLTVVSVIVAILFEPVNTIKCTDATCKYILHIY